jgi:hypothetical protein
LDSSSLRPLALRSTAQQLIFQARTRIGMTQAAK